MAWNQGSRKTKWKQVSHYDFQKIIEVVIATAILLEAVSATTRINKNTMSFSHNSFSIIKSKACVNPSM